MMMQPLASRVNRLVKPSAAARVPRMHPISPRTTKIVVRSTSGSSTPSEKSPVLDSGKGGNGGVNNGSGGQGGGGGGGGSNPSGSGGSPLSPELVAILAAAGRTVESFPSDFAQGLLAGKVTAEILKRYLEVEAWFLAKLVWGIAGFRERLLADPSFFVKLGIEVGIGVCTKLTAEYTKRADNFYAEIDFVAANVVMAIVADFMLVWLPAPTLSYAPRTAKAGGALATFFAGCPDNAFQKVQPGMTPFSTGQRVGAVLRNGAKLMGVGISASLLGVTLTNSLIFLRQLLDPSFAPPNKPQNVLATSAAYGLYMSTSSNLRYQLVAGVIEERGIETMFAGKPQVCHALSFVVRTLNTFVGSLLWVDFVRLLGMQKAEKAESH